MVGKCLGVGRMASEGGSRHPFHVVFCLLSTSSLCLFTRHHVGLLWAGAICPFSGIQGTTVLQPWGSLFLVLSLSSKWHCQRDREEHSGAGGHMCFLTFISPVPELMGGEGMHCGPRLGLDLRVCKGPQLTRSLGQLGLLSLSAVVQSLEWWWGTWGKKQNI